MNACTAFYVWADLAQSFRPAYRRDGRLGRQSEKCLRCGGWADARGDPAGEAALRGRKQRRERNARRPKAFAAIAGENGKASRRRLDLEHAHAESGVRAHVGESCQSHEARKQPHLGFVGVFAGANPEVSLGGFDSSG